MYADLERPPLSQQRLTRDLQRASGLWDEVRVLETCESTNAEAAAAARAGAAEGLVVVAESQTAGRGRLDRQWVSPPRAGLTFSVLLSPLGDQPDWGWLPLMVGLGVAQALAEQAEVDAWLKWPNDVLIGGRKVAGILAEVAAPDRVVVGVGLNVTTTREELPREDATSLLLEAAASTDRELLIKAILRRIESAYISWESSPAAFREQYRRLCSTIGRQVVVHLPGGDTAEGTASAVDDEGHLVVETSDGRVVLAAGDVVHVRPTSAGAEGAVE